MSRDTPDRYGESALPFAVHTLIDSITTLQAQGAAAYASIVDDLIADNSYDVNTIKRTLDGLLDFAGNHQGLALYRRLCRHLWDIDQQAAAAYVQFYREFWDPANERPWNQLPVQTREEEGR